MKVVGGAALALYYDDHRVTSDVDAVFDNYDEVREAVVATARKLGLAEDWVNSQIWDLALPFEKDSGRRTVSVGDNLTMEIASADFLLYAKVIAKRGASQDLDDAVTLARYLGLKTEQEIIKTVERFGRIDGADELFVEEVVAELAEAGAPWGEGSGGAVGRR